MSPRFRKVFRPPLLPIANRFSVLSKMLERQVPVRLGRLIARSGVLLITQFAFGYGLNTGDAPLSVSHTRQSALENRQEAIIVHIDFSAAIDRVNYLGILNKHCSGGI